MTIQEYFGDWSSIIDLSEADRILKELRTFNKPVCPAVKDIYKAFHLCPFNNLKLVILSQDPYPDYRNNIPRATGIAFGNTIDTPEKNYSPSLAILKESVIDFTIPHGIITFDPSLEKWEAQGVLMLNSALSCEKGKIGSHYLIWRPFIRKLLTNISLHSTGLVFLLMGGTAHSFEDCIDTRYHFVFKSKHPSWYARNRTRMDSDIWKEINKLLIYQTGKGIDWFEEY